MEWVNSDSEHDYEKEEKCCQNDPEIDAPPRDFEFHFDMRTLTELIIHTGYEDRLPDNGEDGEWFHHPYMTPLTVGGRVVMPEEVDFDLQEVLDEKAHNACDDVEEVQDVGFATVGKYDVTFKDPPTTGNPAPLSTLFKHYKPDNGDPLTYRNEVATTRKKLAQEVNEICDATGYSYEFNSGLCLRLHRCETPMEINRWIYQQSYCGCFSPTGIFKIAYIERNNHKILITYFDAESG